MKPSLRFVRTPSSARWLRPLLGAAVVAAVVPGVVASAATVSNCASSTNGSYTAKVCVNATSPATGAAPVSATVQFTTGSASVTSVEFDVDGKYLLTDYEAPYQFTWPSAQYVDASHSMTAVATMRDGFQTTAAAVAVTTTNGVTTPPAITGSWSPTSGTTPAAGQPFTVAAFGDGAGGETAESNVVNLVSGWNPNLLTYLGDVYAKGTYTEFQNWYGTSGSFFSKFASITDPVVGNHEYTSDPNADGYFRYWQNIPHYYGYDAGGWHFFALDSTLQGASGTLGQAQYDWLASQLPNYANQCTVVYFHHPLYNIGSESPATRMQSIYQLAAANHVTLVLTGHDHTYQRWQPMNGSGAVDANGPTQIVDGTGGHSSMNFVTSDTRVAASDRGYGATKIQLFPDRADVNFYLADGTTSGRLSDSAHVPCQGRAIDTSAPTAPSGLTATASRPSGSISAQVALKWSAAADGYGVAEYRIFRGGTQVASVPYNATSWTDSNVRDSTSYTYTVLAADARGNASPASNAATVTTPAPVPTTQTFTVAEDTYTNSGTTSNYGTATALRASSGSPTYISYLKFNLANLQPNVQSAHLQVYANSNGAKGLDVRTVSGTWTEKTLTSNNTLTRSAPVASLSKFSAGLLDLDVTRAVTGNGALSLALTTTGTTQQSFSSKEGANPAKLIVSSATPPDSTSPSAPTGLAATPVDESTMKLAWTAATDNVGVRYYDIYRDGAMVASVDAPTTSYTDVGLNVAQSYNYTVVAVDYSGNTSVPSTGVTAKTADVTPPDSPDTMTATTMSSSSVQVAWSAADDNVGVTGYTLTRTSGGTTTSWPLTGSTLSYTDSGLTPLTTYTYTVTARDAAGNTSMATSATATTFSSGGTPAPNPPTGVTVTGSKSALVSWTASPTSGVSYEVYRDGVAVATSLAGTSWTDTSVGSATTYKYQVDAVDGSSVHSALAPTAGVSWTSADTQAPTTPTNLTATAGSSSVALSWTAATDDVGVTGYNVYRNSQKVASKVSGTTYTDASLPAGQYSYTVTAVDAVGNESSPSTPSTVTLGNATSTQLTPVADAYVSDGSPASNYGISASLRVDDAAPAQHSWLKFTVSNTQPTITSAVLKFYATNTASKGVAVYTASDVSWSETGLTWNTQPIYGTAPVATAPATPSGGGWTQADVSSVIKAAGTYTFVLTLPAGAVTAAPLSSKEGANPPQLVVTSAP